jgi:hypothetical protein
MYACPTCDSISVTFMSKWLSSSAAPARCDNCGSSCAIAIFDAAGAVAAAAVLVTLSGFGAIALHAAYPLAIGVVLAVGYYFLRQHRARLIPITSHETTAAKRSTWAAIIALLFPWGSF